MTTNRTLAYKALADMRHADQRGMALTYALLDIADAIRERQQPDTPYIDALLTERFGTSQDGNNDGVDVDLGTEADYVDHMNKIQTHNIEVRNTITGARNVITASGNNITDAQNKVERSLRVNAMGQLWEVVR